MEEFKMTIDQKIINNNLLAKDDAEYLRQLIQECQQELHTSQVNLARVENDRGQLINNIGVIHGKIMAYQVVLNRLESGKIVKH